MEKECEKIEEDVDKTDPPAIINSGHPKIKTQVDTSCNLLWIESVLLLLFFAVIIKHNIHQVCWHFCVTCKVSPVIHPALSQQEKLFLANREKDKGNEAFRAKDYEEAVTYYSRSGCLNNSFIAEST